MGLKQPNDYDFLRRSEGRRFSFQVGPVARGFLLLTIGIVVALSADCQDSTKQLCLSAGMNAFFSKPLKKSA